MITEGKEGVINSMIKKHGLFYTIKFLGGYDRVKKMNTPLKLTKWQKIGLIKDVVNKMCEKFGSTVFGTGETHQSPIFVESNDEVTSQIEFFNRDSVYVDVYYIDTDVLKGDLTIKYENLDEGILDDVFEFMININD
jgi:hypothetical protein